MIEWWWLLIAFAGGITSGAVGLYGLYLWAISR